MISCSTSSNNCLILAHVVVSQCIVEKSTVGDYQSIFSVLLKGRVQQSNTYCLIESLLSSSQSKSTPLDSTLPYFHSLYSIEIYSTTGLLHKHECNGRPCFLFLQFNLSRCALHSLAAFTTPPYKFYYSVRFILPSFNPGFTYKLYYTLRYIVHVLGYTFKPLNAGITTLPYKLNYTLRYAVLVYTFKPFKARVTTPL